MECSNPGTIKIETNVDIIWRLIACLFVNFINSIQCLELELSEIKQAIETTAKFTANQTN